MKRCLLLKLMRKVTSFFVLIGVGLLNVWQLYKQIMSAGIIYGIKIGCFLAKVVVMLIAAASVRIYFYFFCRRR